MADPTSSPGPAPVRGIRRAFTLPIKLVAAAEETKLPKPGPELASQDIETLFACPGSRIYVFNTASHTSTTHSLHPIATGSEYLDDEGFGTLPWRTQTERLVAAGPLRIYRVPGSVAFLNAGTSFLKPILAKSQCWCVDGETKFVLKKGGNDFYRIELPNETQQDEDRALDFSKALNQVLRYEKTPCPFKRGFFVEIPENPQITYVPWKPKHKPVTSLRSHELEESSQIETILTDFATASEEHMQMPPLDIQQEIVEFSSLNDQKSSLEVSPSPSRGLKLNHSIKDTIGKFETLDKRNEQYKRFSLDLSKPIINSQIMEPTRSGRYHTVETLSNDLVQDVNPILDGSVTSSSSTNRIRERMTSSNTPLYANVSCSTRQDQSSTWTGQDYIAVGLSNEPKESATDGLIGTLEPNHVRSSDIGQEIQNLRDDHKTAIEAKRPVKVDERPPIDQAIRSLEVSSAAEVIATSPDDGQTLDATVDINRPAISPETKDSKTTLLNTLKARSSSNDPVGSSTLTDLSPNPSKEPKSAHNHATQTEMNKSLLLLSINSAESQKGISRPISETCIQSQLPASVALLPRDDRLKPVYTSTPGSSDTDCTEDKVLSASQQMQSSESFNTSNFTEIPNGTLREVSSNVCASEAVPKVQPITRKMRLKQHGGLTENENLPSDLPVSDVATFSTASDDLEVNDADLSCQNYLDQGQAACKRLPAMRYSINQFGGHEYERIGAVIGEKMAGVLLGPPLQLANLMLRIAKKFVNGARIRDEEGKGWQRRGEIGRRLPGTWEYFSDEEDLQDLYMKDDDLS